MDDFSKLELPEPNLAELKTRYDEIAQGIQDLNGNDGRGEQLFQWIEHWDDVRREIDSWCNLTEIRFNQDTKNPAYKAAMDRLDEIHPKLTDLDV